jgi:putative transposase
MPESTPATADRTYLVAVPAFQAEAILACDFFIVGLLNGTQAYVLAVIERATRRIRILGVTQYPTGAWTTQQAATCLWTSASSALGSCDPGQVSCRQAARTRMRAD